MTTHSSTLQRESNHVNLIIERSLPVALHHHQMENHHKQMSHLQENSTPHNNPPKLVPHVPNDPYSDPNFSYYSLLDSSDSYDLSESGYSKQRQRARKKQRGKRRNNDPIKNCTNITDNALKPARNSKVIRFKHSLA